MFGTFDTKIRSVNPIVMTDQNDTPRRVTNFDLQFEMGDDLAAGLGSVAQDALKHLKAGEQKSCIMLLDAVQCLVEFDAGTSDKHKLEKVVAVRAAATMPNAEDATPNLKLTLSMATKHEHLCWLVDHIGPTVKVSITRAQTELPIEVEQPQGPFILRLKETNGGGGAPKVALFESADASWIGTAMVDVASRLADHLNTFAVSNVPVLV